MRTVRAIVGWIGMAGAAAAQAQPAVQTAMDNPPPVIIVTGSATAATPPDLARLSFTLRGEGDSAEAAARALAGKRDAAAAALGRFGNPRIEAGSVTVGDARDKACGGGGWMPPNQMSSGACAVIGRIATLSATIKLVPADRAATAAGALAAAGASDVRVIAFELADRQAAEQRATVQAFADAKRQAETIATASGVKLGPVRRVSDGSYVSPPIIATARAAGEAPPPPPPPPPPAAPVEIGLTPRPVETMVRLQVVFAILP